QVTIRLQLPAAEPAWSGSRRLHSPRSHPGGWRSPKMWVSTTPCCSADAPALSVEQQNRVRVEAGSQWTAGGQRPVILRRDGQEVAVAGAGIGIGLGAQVLDHLDGDVELAGAAGAEMLGTETDGDGARG